MEVIVNERKIWWIASYPKSGNTWVRMFINAYVSGFPIDINSGFQYALGDNNKIVFQCCATKPVDILTELEQVYIRPAALVALLNMSMSKHVCLKTHHAKVKVEDMPLIPPKLSAGGVYIVRDPRDIAISFADHMGEPIDKIIKCMNMREYMAVHKISKLIHVLVTWSLHVISWTSKNVDVPIEVIRYEDMLEKTSETFRKIVKALGFSEINEERFNFALEQTKFSNLKAMEEKEGFREKGAGDKFFRVGKAEQWKDILTKKQIKQIEEDHAEIMEKMGYEFSQVPAMV